MNRLRLIIYDIFDKLVLEEFSQDWQGIVGRIEISLKKFNSMRKTYYLRFCLKSNK